MFFGYYLKQTFQKLLCKEILIINHQGLPINVLNYSSTCHMVSLKLFCISKRGLFEIEVRYENVIIFDSRTWIDKTRYFDIIQKSYM